VRKGRLRAPPRAPGSSLPPRGRGRTCVEGARTCGGGRAGVGHSLGAPGPAARGGGWGLGLLAGSFQEPSHLSSAVSWPIPSTHRLLRDVACVAPAMAVALDMAGSKSSELPAPINACAHPLAALTHWSCFQSPSSKVPCPDTQQSPNLWLLWAASRGSPNSLRWSLISEGLQGLSQLAPFLGPSAGCAQSCWCSSSTV